MANTCNFYTFYACPNSRCIYLQCSSRNCYLFRKIKTFCAWHRPGHGHGKILLLCKFLLDKSTCHHMRGQFLESLFKNISSQVAYKSVQPTEKSSKNFLENSACEIITNVGREGWRGPIILRILSDSKISGRVHTTTEWPPTYYFFAPLAAFFYDQQYSECEQGKNAFDISCTYCHAVGMYFFKHTVFP